jgi:hypothetical protein
MGDQMILAQLERAGADLRQPRHVIHYLYFDEEQPTHAAATTLDSAGFAITVRPPSDRIAQWSTTAEATRVVDAQTIEPSRVWFEQLARTMQGKYDGWEAAARP